MKILLVHNYYQQPGGEDRVFADEYDLLTERGHEVGRYSVHNDKLKQCSPISTALMTIWNKDAANTLRDMVRHGDYQIVHFHNTFPILSPAVYQAVRNAGAAVVQSLHNFRLLCAGATLFRNGGVCELCVGQSTPFAALRHRCYRDNLGATAALVGMQLVHRALGTYRNHVDAYIVMTRFAKEKFIQGGLPQDALHIKPNFMTHDPVKGNGKGGYALFVGRLTEDKGVDVLLKAWRMKKREFTLRIVGDGPKADSVLEACSQDPSIQWLGWQSKEEVYAQLASAEFLIMPSLWYEGFPKTLIEAMSHGTPTVASNLGSLADVVDHGGNGWHFEPNNANELCRLLDHLESSPDELVAARRHAVERYHRLYTAHANYPLLMSIYHAALRRRGKPPLADVEATASLPLEEVPCLSQT